MGKWMSIITFEGIDLGVQQQVALAEVLHIIEQSIAMMLALRAADALAEAASAPPEFIEDDDVEEEDFFRASLLFHSIYNSVTSRSYVSQIIRR